ncbi:MAG TPA: SDR family oxidoreductase [Acidimicrobiales bacterium]
MKIVVIGGTGLIGSKLLAWFRAHGHDAVPAAPDTGVNTLTGEGLAVALQGADVVVDVSNAPSWGDAAVLEFFETSTRNLLDTEAATGVGHHVALSIVGDADLPDSGYMRAKVAQEALIEDSSIPYSIVQATQFFEFVGRIADGATEDDVVRLPPVLFQPMAADDVAAAVGQVAVAPPLMGRVEIAGPDQFRFDELVRGALAARHDPRRVVADPDARYFGTRLDERSLVPDAGARLAATRFEDWLARQP